MLQFNNACDCQQTCDKCFQGKEVSEQLLHAKLNGKFRTSLSENLNVGQRCEVYFRDFRPSQSDNEYSQPTYDLHGRRDSEGLSNASGAFTMSNLP
ncbi:unnamed protein product [Schistosoma mattheei]|uniref:Uncharacterized protein n=1 Tax=Schistosoma mattheei TaxID=31246 RepID=A0A183PGC3_9TREM|nr:unnamed protein product [Schistosoma mattheei]